MRAITDIFTDVLDQLTTLVSKEILEGVKLVEKEKGIEPGTLLAAILAGVSEDGQAGIAGGNTARVYHFDVARLTIPA